MRRRHRSAVIAAAAALALLFSGSVAALGVSLAEEELPTVTLSERGGVGIFTFNRPGENLLDNFSAVMPGDALTQTIVVRTDGGNSAPWQIHLSLDDVENDPFLSQLGLEVELDGATVTAESGQVFLGELAPGQSRTLTAKLTVPITLGNAFQGAEGQVDWHFSAQQIPYIPPIITPSPTPSVSPSAPPSISHSASASASPDVTPSPTPSETLIPDEEIPGETVTAPPSSESPLPTEAEEIETGENVSDMPATGDDGHTGIYLGLMALSGVGLVVLLWPRKKKD